MNEGSTSESASHPHERQPKSASAFLEMLASHESIPLDTEVAVVVAHPDDESIGFGAQIGRFSHCSVIHLTDGAPDDREEWKGLESKRAYAEIREKEKNAALDAAGHTGERISFGLTDQSVPFVMAENAERLACLFAARGTRFVLTHAYEGGHPDHDATAFSVHAARAILEKKSIPLDIIEAPLYRVGDDGKKVWQDFVPDDSTKTYSFELDGEEQSLKARLRGAYVSQGSSYRSVSDTVEKLREAPRYDFSKLPNGGNLTNIYAHAGVSSEKWLELIREADEELKPN